MLRNEIKYLVPNYYLDKLRSRLSVFVQPDVFVCSKPEGFSQYTVRSIYFDNRALDAYHEKHSGVFLRKKFRVRGYNCQQPQVNVVLEIKRKIGNRVKKNRAIVKYENLNDLFSTGNIDMYVANNGKDQNAKIEAGRFLFYYGLKQLIPACLIAYEREAYHGLFDPGVRITFDKNLRSRMFPPTTGLFAEERLKKFFPGHFILEIKYFSETMPSWARSLVQEFGLRHEALSKYTLGIDTHLSNGITKAG